MDKNYPPPATRYVPVIGLEVHVELKTRSKMFCRCDATYFGKSPNTHTCPVCLGLPGALPYPNKQAIEWCVKIALALNCKINKLSKFDRKNYFYPDLSKGYQISQYDIPFGQDGFIEVKAARSTLQVAGSKNHEPPATRYKRIGITRVHMEEDTAKLTHQFGIQNSKFKIQNDSLIDFNRSGVPLVEIVTEPDFENEYQVVQYLQKLQKIVRYLGVSNADMERGDMRLEPNISLSRSTWNVANGENSSHPPPAARHLPPYKVEVKNINSFKFVDRAIKFEIERQSRLLDEGTLPAQETRGWNETKNETISQRSKEEAHDYRYFPEPDIPPIVFNQDQIRQLADEIGELPDAKQKRFEQEYRLPSYDSEILTREKPTADFFDNAVEDGKSFDVLPREIANLIINQKIDISKFEPAEVVKMILENKKKEELSPDVLASLIESVLSENQKAIDDFKKGNENAIMFLLGMVMRKAGKKLDPILIKNGILEKIKS